MDEFRDEGICALTPQSGRPLTEAAAPKTWIFVHKENVHVYSPTRKLSH
jgi:hypothetical protein